MKINFKNFLLKSVLSLVISVLSFSATAMNNENQSLSNDALGAYQFYPPVERSYGEAEIQAAVNVEQKFIVDTRSSNNLEMPDACKNVRYISYSPRNLDGEIDKHLFLTTGIFQDTNAFVHFAENFVYNAKNDRNLDVAVHVIARRDSCLHDKKGLQDAVEAKDTDLAISYYFGRKLNAFDRVMQFFASLFNFEYDVTPSNYKGLYDNRSEELAFLSEFSLAMMINDIDQVVDAEADPEANGKEKVFMGGQSMGGILSAVYSSWDFDNNPDTTDDAGYNKVNGFVALDTLITTDSSKLIGYDVLPENLLPALTDPQLEDYYADLDALRNQESGLFVNLPGFGPQTFVMFALMGMEASWNPRQESTLLKRLPFESNKDLDTYVRLTHSQSVPEFLLQAPGQRTQRYTTSAMLGLSFDENFAPIAVTHSSFGYLKNVEVQPKYFPLIEPLRFFLPDISSVIGHYMAPLRSFGIHPNEAQRDTVIDWANFDEIGNEDNKELIASDGRTKLTGASSEASDINQFARSLYRDNGLFFGWYMSSRLVNDIRNFNILPNDQSTGLQALHRGMIPQVRKIEFIGTEGVDWPGGSKWSTALIPVVGYDHAEVLTASFNTPERRPNELLVPIYDFLQGQGQF